MTPNVNEIIGHYDPNLPLDQASTIPSSWYTDKDFYELELKTVFSRSWQLAGRLDQVAEPGQYVTSDIAGEPVVIVRGNDGVLRGFFNVCRHHAAAVMTEPEGKAAQLRCPYHGWTYSLEGELKGTPDFSGVCNFDRASNGLVPLEMTEWENWIFVKLDQSEALVNRFSRRRSGPTNQASSTPRSSLVRTTPLQLRLQLESLCRQLSRRRLSRALPAQRPRQRARLQQLHDRERQASLFAVEPDCD